MTEETTTPDLSSLLAEKPAQEQEQAQEADIVEQIGNAIDALQNSLASMHILVRTVNTRLASVEKYVSYLLEKDPEVGAKIKEHMAKIEAEAKAQDGTQAEK